MTDAVATISPSLKGSRRAVRGGSRAIAAWLWIVAAMVFAMVFLGGATRLTESGLSITEWKLLSGVLPPLGHAQWLDAFNKYKQIPQYEALFPTMTLGHFQAIYLMEWFHRLVGRALGLALFVPLVVFWARGALTRRLKLQMTGVVALVALQGFVGWWMVSSGLRFRVEVAQERLATHLLLASFTFAALIWIATAQTARSATRRSAAPAGLRRLASLLVLLVFVQIGFGALVAGLRAGLAYNTWPLMDGHFILPADVLGAMSPLWRNVVDNLATVQFQHRMTAYLILAVAIGQALWTARSVPRSGASRRAWALVALVAVQATIGIVTLLLAVPIWAGLLHQLFAMVVLAMVVVHRERLGATSVLAIRHVAPSGRSAPGHVARA